VSRWRVGQEGGRWAESGAEVGQGQGGGTAAARRHAWYTSARRVGQTIAASLWEGEESPDSTGQGDG